MYELWRIPCRKACERNCIPNHTLVSCQLSRKDGAGKERRIQGTSHTVRTVFRQLTFKTKNINF